MNPRLSLQGRMSLDDWNGVGGDRGSIDVHGAGSVRGSRHGRQSSIYRSQTTNLFNTFEGPDGDVVLNPVSPSRHLRTPRRPTNTDLHELQEADEWEHNNDYLDDNDDEHTALRGKVRKAKSSQQTSSVGHNDNIDPPRISDVNGQNADDRSPVQNVSSSDVRIP